jgi:hypothetical protein
MGRRRTNENHSPQKNNSIQDSVGNENGYPVPDLNTTMINVTRNSAMPTKKPSKKKYLRNSWRRY